MNKQLVIATNNGHKVDEFKKIFEPIGFEVTSTRDLGIDLEVEETASTYQENALLKAMAYRDLVSGWILADDSGIEIEALDFQPGVYSARYLGEQTPYEIKNRMILEKLEEETNRRAQFVCSIALVNEEGSYWVTINTCKGSIAHQILGSHGFGYDPIFIPDGFEQSFAQLPPEVKNEVSHRGKASKAAATYLHYLSEESYHE